MGDLAKYIAEVVEFVVAGVLVFFSLLLLGYVVVRPDLAELPDELPFLSSLGGLLPVVGIALIYALGIIAEGMSRIMFEHGLGELTAEKLRSNPLADQPGGPPSRRTVPGPARRRGSTTVPRWRTTKACARSGACTCSPTARR